MSEKNGNFQKQALNDSDTIYNFSNIKNLEKNKKRPKGKKINSEKAQNYDNSTTKFTTYEKDYKPILEEVNYDFSKFTLIEIENHNLSKEDKANVISILINKDSASNNINISKQKSIGNDIKTKKENTSEGSISDDSFSLSAKNEIVKPDIEKENSDKEKISKAFNLLDETKTMLKINDKDNERYSIINNLNINLNKKRKRIPIKKSVEKNKKNKKLKDN